MSRILCRCKDYELRYYSGSRRRQHRCKYVSIGPNYACHIDYYEKLKLLGFSVHYQIDGVSGKLIWLKGRSSNKNQRYSFYLRTKA